MVTSSTGARFDGVPTIADVAERAGVSPMTVSRVLAGRKNVSADKVDRVLHAVSLLGYRRNENARSLRPGQKTGLVGVVITNVSNPYYGGVLSGVDEVLAPAGMRMLVGVSAENLEREQQLIADFVGRQVDGLIVVSAGPTADHLQPSSLPGTPIVLAARQVSGLSADTVVLDEVQGTAQALGRLIAEGHRRLAFVGGTATVPTTRRRLEGFTQAHTEAGVQLHQQLVRAGQSDPESARAVTWELLSLPEPPTVIFAADNRNAVGVVRALYEFDGGRLRGGDSPVVVAFDDFEFSDLVPFAISVIDHSARELGQAAAGLLLERLGDEPGTSRRPRLLLLPTVLRRRGSAMTPESTKP